MAFLIAEIGNNHFGSFKKAKELIRVAHECGADLIKGQAFHAEDLTSGSMPKEFYEVCEFAEDECIELIDYARGLGNDMFFSVFSPGFDRLKKHQLWTKFAASQSLKFTPEQDTPSTIVSFSHGAICGKTPKRMQHATALFATEYCKPTVSLRDIDALRILTGAGVGLSDHTLGVDLCLKALLEKDLVCIEKHFTLKHDLQWCGQIFRDTTHGANPRQLQILANTMSKIQGGLQ